MNLIPISYRLPWSRFDVADEFIRAEITATKFKDGVPIKWAVRQRGFVLGKDGEWEYEPNPFSHTEEFLAATRFDSLEEAYAAAEKHFTSEPKTENP